MKLEIGKLYKLRNGYKAKIYEIYPEYVLGAYLSCDGTWYPFRTNSDGYFTTWGLVKNDFDVLSEWQEPLDFDWDSLPKWADRWIAMDESKVWFAYSHPALSEGRWDADDGYCSCIPTEYYPKNFTASWEDSLFENPKYKNKLK